MLVAYDSAKAVIHIKIDLLLIVSIILFIILAFLAVRGGDLLGMAQLEVASIKLSIRGVVPIFEWTIKSNEVTSSIAHRIYVELMTRKAALEFNPEQDVIEEVYSSWYELFKILRNELKEVPGKYLKNDKSSTSALAELTIEIMNSGLRPHLTKYQADFLKWYKIEKDKDINRLLSPQEVQKKYPKYGELVEDMKNANRILYEYALTIEQIVKTQGKIKVKIV